MNDKREEVEIRYLDITAGGVAGIAAAIFALGFACGILVSGWF